MKIYLASPRGFCSGVRRAIEIVENFLDQTSSSGQKVSILHEIVHNDHVVQRLVSQGAKIIHEPEDAPAGSTLIFSAHGVSEAIERRAHACSLNLIDATCPLVKTVQRKAAQLSLEGYSIILFGKRGHREVEGILGRIQGESHLIETPEQASSFVPVAGKRYACLSQTTLNAEELAVMVDLLNRKIPSLLRVAAVCNATSERQNAVRALAAQCDSVIVVGSVKSSNSKRLAEIAASAGARTILISSVQELPESFLTQTESLGIASGASAPDDLVQETLRHLEDKGGVFAGEIHG